jgi:hypothetical protein
MNKKLRHDNNNIAYEFKDPDIDSKFLLDILTNEVNYFEYILKGEKDSKRRKAIKADISISEILINSMINE